MSNVIKDEEIEENIADPFSDNEELDLDLSGLTSNIAEHESIQTSSTIDDLKTKIEKIAIEGNFTERKVIKEKPIIYPKTASFYEEELNIIDSARSDFKKYVGIVPKPSDSDVQRAALRAFERLPLEQRMQLLYENIARKKRR